jgi:DNA replication and repair protein RecF
MQIDRLSLTSFRNYQRLELELPRGVVLLHGDNAQGKSNLLEALHLLATSRSPRAGSDRELISWQAADQPMPYAQISAMVKRGGGYVALDLIATRNEGAVSKRFRVNNAPKRAAEAIGTLAVTHFAPTDIDLVSGSPANRRRFLDIMLSQVDKRYLRALQELDRVLKQRNALLRMIREGQARPAELAFWDEALVEHGAIVMEGRLRAVAALARRVETLHPTLAGRSERLDARYSTNAANGEPLAPGDAATALRSAIPGALQREIAQGVSLVGPHRDDIALQVDGVEAAAFGSRGQQRTAALSLKLAEADFIRAETGETPVLLLDDVLSELDSRRRRQVAAAARATQQVIMTATDLQDFEQGFLNDCAILVVQGGVIRRGA